MLHKQTIEIKQVKQMATLKKQKQFITNGGIPSIAPDFQRSLNS